MTKSLNELTRANAPVDEDWLGGLIARRLGTQVVISGRACEYLKCDDVRTEICDLLRCDGSAAARQAIVLDLGPTATDTGAEAQESIDKFVILRRSFEEWAHDADLRVVGGYLRPVGASYSAVFELEHDALWPPKADQAI